MGLGKHRDATLEFRVLGSDKLALGPRSYPRKCSFKATFCHRVVVKAADGIGTATRMAYGQLQTNHMKRSMSMKTITLALDQCDMCILPSILYDAISGSNESFT